ncbi:hypothetical protein EV44_g3886 [Erysiphe necator]|uniref:Reverse transcriptase Ty1/copia-type domain-containing protein n=1 Tax=Uncinula necator TaxID=52586 RepID=A0A0B1NUL4_UNCNE|nr:hypothetical protein EV44_g3886 [Erysiphe necator]
MIICVKMIFPSWKIYSRDISQAYTQSGTKLNRKFFIKAPKEISIGDENILQVLLPLYGVPEAGTHWFARYHKWHLDALKLSTSSYDPCLMFGPNSIVGLQTDDTLYASNQEYANFEDTELKKAKFKAKDIEILSENFPMTFNGVNIKIVKDSICMTQQRQCRKIELINPKNKDFKSQYVCQRARGAYIASMIQPEASFSLSYAAQTTDPSTDDVELLNKCLKWQFDNQSRGLRFIKLSPKGLKTFVFVDAK